MSVFHLKAWSPNGQPSFQVKKMKIWKVLNQIEPTNTILGGEIKQKPKSPWQSPEYNSKL